MRRSIAWLAVLLSSCGGGSASPGADDGGAGDSSTPPVDAADAMRDSSAEAGADASPDPCHPGETCIDVDVATSGHTVSALLFGDNVEWLNDGDHLWDTATSALRPAQLALLKTLGVTQLRYPGGTLSDFFHWKQAIGPLGSRTPQIDPFSSTASKLVTQVPDFGPDELVALSRALGAEPLITANAATGTPEEAAAWLQDLRSKGVSAKLWEIGNELWLKDDSWAGTIQTRTPAEYAAIFDAYAAALRAVDPTVRVGAIGCHPMTPVSLCRDPSWNQVLLSTVNERIDFLAVHDAYAPAEIGLEPDEDKVFRAMLGAPEQVRANLDAVESDIDTYAKPASKGLTIAITEHASLFVPNPAEGTDAFIATLTRNWTLASAIYSAAIYRLMMSDPRVTIANHLPINGPWESPLNEGPDGVSVVFRSAFFHVFRSLADGAKGTFIRSTVSGSPTFDSSDYGFVGGVKGAPSLLSLAVQGPERGRLRVWVINRDLTTEVRARLTVRGRPLPSAATVDVLDGPSAAAMNSADASTVIAPTTASLPPANERTFTFPAHSLVRFTLD